MEQYIPKSDLVAKIEKLEKLYCYGKSDGMLIAKSVFDSIKNIINTQEVKEVDLEKVFNDEYSKFSNDTDAMDYAFPIDLADFKDFAKHFFELGMAASNKE